MSGSRGEQSAGAGSTWAVLAVCAVMFGAMAWGLTGGRSSGGEAAVAPLEFPAPTLDASALSAARKKFHKPDAGLWEREASKDMIALVRLANDHQFETKPVPTKGDEELSLELEVGATELLQATSTNEFVEVGSPLYAECAEGLAALQADLAAGKVTLEEATRDPDYETYSSYRRACGNVLGMLKARRLVDGEGQWEDPATGPALLELLQRYRWAFLANTQHRPQELMAPLDLESLTRWRIGAVESFSHAERMQFARMARESDPDYPTAMAIALLYREAGQEERGATELSRAATLSEGAERKAYEKWLAQYRGEDKK
jgi:hypothetical protein